MTESEDRSSSHPVSGGAPSSDVVSLSQFRARHAQDLRQRRLDALLDSASPELAIRSLRGDELYDLLRAGDLNEHADLLAHARAEQVQVVLDLALWQGDRLSPRGLEDWVELVAGMPSDTVGRWIAGLDIELVGLMIRKGARVYDLEIEEPPDEPEGMAWPTPDRLFVLDVTGYREQVPEAAQDQGAEPAAEVAGHSAEALIQLMDRLYRADLNLARRILVGVKAELDSDLEEMAYRWRQGRLQDLGFEDPLAAREIFRELDPASVHLGELRPGTRVRAAGVDADQLTSGLPPALAVELDSVSPFATAVARVTDPSERSELNAALAALANRYLAAERVDPADDAAVASDLARLRATLDLGVEYLARQAGAFDEDRAVDAVRTVALGRVFRVGVSLTGKLRALARALLRRGPFASLAGDGLDLTEEPETTALASVNRFVPAFPRLLDDPPGNGDRPISSLADVARLTAAIERAAAAQAMLVGLGVRPAHLSGAALDGVEPRELAALDASVLARTALVRLLLDDDEGARNENARQEAAPARETSFRPLAPAEVTRFKKRYAQSAALAQRAQALLAPLIPARLDRAGREVSERWLATLAPLEPVLVRGAR